VAAPLSHAFGHTFWWAVGMSVVAAVPAVILYRAQRTREPEPIEQPEPQAA
jgi:hypothetical protein